MKIKIDDNAGFCFGVVRAIETAEKHLEQEGTLYCLGDIVHNTAEVRRLKEKGPWGATLDLCTRRGTRHYAYRLDVSHRPSLAAENPQRV